MQRRQVVLAGLLLPAVARAHHGWSSFDQDRPVYLQGTAADVKWRNPHVELKLQLPADLKLPADLQARAVPAQSAPVDGKALLARTVLPTRKDRSWDVELAPLTRMQAWNVPEIKAGQSIEVVGFTFKDEKGDAILRAEYVFIGGKAYGLRSSPA